MSIVIMGGGLVPRALGWRRCAPPEVEIFIEVHDSDDGIPYHQRLTLRQGALVGSEAVDGGGGHLAALASTVRAAAPGTFGLVSPSSLQKLLGVIVASLKEEGGGSASGAQWTAGGRAPAATAAAPLPSALAGIGDLQRAGPAMLQAAKAKMDIVFQAHRVSKDDPSFVYDKRAEFGAPEEASDWD